MTSFLDRVLGRQPQLKATLGGAVLSTYSRDIPLSVYGQDWQTKAANYLHAYRVGWFYKGGSRIARDFANLAWTLAYEDTEGDNAEEITAAPSGQPFEQLDPLEQFLRLYERPNPIESGRVFRQRQMIRLDFTGRALVYMENGDGGGLPTALYGINPARMWPSRDAEGNLVGWVLDKNRPSGGVPFTSDEILVIEYPSGDEDPMGVVEAVYAQVPLTSAIAQHTADLLSTGGRLAGMAWPKERALSEDEFTDAQRAWRNVASDPNAARRLLLFPEPMEFTQGAASPKDLALAELAALSRDEILTSFPIAPEMLMVPMASGLNSGLTQQIVEERYWSGTLHPRVEIWEDAFQQTLIPRYEAAVGKPLDFDIEEPDLDDAPAIIEKVGAFKGLVAAGFDPKEAVAYVGLDTVKWNGLPALMDPAKQAAMAQQAAQAPSSGMTVTAGDSNRRDQSQATQDVVKVKAVTRDAVVDREFPGLRATIADFLTDQRVRITRNIEATLPPTKAERMVKANDEWWDQAAEDDLLRERLRTVYLSIGRDALTVVAENTSRIISNKAVDRVLHDLLARSGLRITDINETTRKTIAATLETGVKRGYSIPQLVNGVPEEAFGGVQGALMANGVNVWDSYRAEVIARTETMTAYNEAALLGYKDVNVAMVTAIDGDKDDECASRDGRDYPIDEAFSIVDHPNGTLDWVPITKSAERDDNVVWLDALKAIAERPAPVTHNHFNLPAIDAPITVTTPQIVMPEQPAAVVNVTMPEQAAPVVNVTNIPPAVEVHPADVHMDAPVVHVAAAEAPVVNITNIPPSVDVAAPEVHIDAPVVNVTLPEQPAPVVNVTLPDPKPTAKSIERDAKGQITRIVES